MNWICRSSIRHPTEWKWKQTLEEECSNRKGELGQKSAIETSAAEEEELEICSSSGRRRRRIRGIHERAPRKLLIAESSNSSRLATLHYSHFIQQLLLPPPITNTHRFTGTHTHWDSHISSITTVHFTACTSPAGPHLNMAYASSADKKKICRMPSVNFVQRAAHTHPGALHLSAGLPFTASGRRTAAGLCALSHQDLVRVHALLQGLAEIRVNKQHIVTPPTLSGSGKKGPGSTERKHSGLQRRRFSLGQITFGTKWEKDLCRFERN